MCTSAAALIIEFVSRHEPTWSAQRPAIPKGPKGGGIEQQSARQRNQCQAVPTAFVLPDRLVYPQGDCTEELDMGNLDTMEECAERLKSNTLGRCKRGL